MRPILPALLLSAVVAGTAAAPPADAAVRACLAPVKSGPQAGADEKEAQRLALDAWAKRAVETGGAKFTAWRLAVARDIQCLRGVDGRFVCEAVGRPCTIEQVAPRDLAPMKPEDRVPETRKGTPL